MVLEVEATPVEEEILEDEADLTVASLAPVEDGEALEELLEAEVRAAVPWGLAAVDHQLDRVEKVVREA